MFYFIKQIAKKFKVIQIVILRILLPVDLYFLRKDFNPSKINMIYKSKFNKKVKFILSSISFKGKKITTYRTFERSFFFKPNKTSVILNSNGRNNEFKNGSDPKLFKYKNKILLNFQRCGKYKRGVDCEICLYDLHLNKVYKIYSPFKFNGKNWIPISGLNSLIFIYSVYPLVILKVVNLNKGRMKIINKIEKPIKPSWNTKDIALSFVGSKRGGSPVVKVNNYTYLGIGHSTEYFNSKYKFLGSKHKAYVYLFDFKKNNYYTNYLTNNQLSWLDCFGAELINKGNKIRFDFSISSNFVSHILSNIYLFDVKLDKRKLIKIARKGLKKKINLIPNYKIIN